MKMLTKLLMAGLVLASVNLASAVTIKITGSTAYRGPTHSAILKLLDSTSNGTTVSVASGASFAYSGSASAGLGKANVAIFKGTFGGNPVIIKCAWSGSVGGVQTVAGSLNVNFPLDGVVTSAGAGTSDITDTTANGAASADLSVPDIAMSDTYQSSTVFNNTFGSPAHAYANLEDKKVGIVPFKWVASAAAPGGQLGLNMTPQLAQSTFVGLGSVPLALYTGANSDHATIVYATGRDADSGTRLTAFAETGIGVNTPVNQYDISTGAPYVAKPINGVSYAAGNGGESSGGNLATKLIAATSTVYVTYFSTGDAATAITGGAKEMTYNGVTYSDAAVKEGKYTFWSYEHLMYRPELTGVSLSFATSLVTKISTDTATLKDSEMQVQRATDGAPVTAKYY